MENLNSTNPWCCKSKNLSTCELGRVSFVVRVLFITSFVRSLIPGGRESLRFCFTVSWKLYHIGRHKTVSQLWSLPSFTLLPSSKPFCFWSDLLKVLLNTYSKSRKTSVWTWSLDILPLRLYASNQQQVATVQPKCEVSQIKDPDPGA